MGNSLLDQLKKTGLVDNKKAQQVKNKQYKNQKKKHKKGSAPEADEATLLARKAQAENIERDRKLNLERKQALEKKAVAAQIKQLIETNRIENATGDEVYHFNHQGLVKSLHLSEAAHRQLSIGRLMIACLADRYELIPAPVAEKILQRDAEQIIPTEPDVEAEEDEEDPYAAYKIPDDLMW